MLERGCRREEPQLRACLALEPRVASRVPRAILQSALDSGLRWGPAWRTPVKRSVGDLQVAERASAEPRAGPPIAAE